MKKEIANKWIAALESGKYQQGKNALEVEENNTSKFCCLGVLCNLAYEEKVIKRIYGTVLPHISYGTFDDMSSTLLPPSVINWAGIKCDNFSGEFGENKKKDATIPEEKRNTLMKLNDKEGFSFKEIANIIRENWETI
jgi:hypothetical protein